jgi:prophage regulatory protein
MAVSISSANPTLINPQALLRLPGVLALFPVSRSCWWQGVSAGRYPAPIRLGPHAVAWRAGDIFELIEKLSKNPPEPDWTPPKKPRTPANGKSAAGSRSRHKSKSDNH